MPTNQAKRNLREQAEAAATPPPPEGASKEIVRRSELESLLARPEVQDRFRAALSGFMDIDAFTGVIVTVCNNSPQLRMADPRTLLVASMHIAMAQLSPSPLYGEAWVVAFRNGQKSKAAGRDVYDAQFLLGYKGVERLALDSGLIRNIGAGLIYADDDLDFMAGTGGYFHHRSGAVFRGEDGRLVARERDPQELPVAAYAFAETIHGGTVFEVRGYEDVLRTREGSHSWRAYQAALRRGSGRAPDTPWATHPVEMVRKTMVHRLRHQLPFSSTAKGLRFAHALQSDGTVGAELPEQVGGMWRPEYRDDEAVVEVPWEDLEPERPEAQEAQEPTPDQDPAQ